MSNFITAPINENGIILDPDIGSILKDAMSPPFRFTDVFVYSHGWWTDATGAVADYNRFSMELTKQLLLIGATSPTLPHLPASSFATAVQWPSTLSFYSMGKRADVVGQHGVYALLRMIFEALSALAAPPSLRLHLLGHSFGCRVVCSALEQISKDGTQVPPAVALDVVLLQAAFNSDELDPNGMYGNASKLNLRLLVTRSDGDTSLGRWYPIAERLVNLFSGRSVSALGAAGPSAVTQTEFGGAGAIAVGPGFTYPAVVPLTERLIAADLSPLHAATGPGYLFSGHHSDIYHDEIYQLIAGFFFR
ncbi:MAG TPA: alpha/beta hydrolase [bacterium]|nr:alpha/beta hydrolase [bacterium]